jgi:hypothetical protein
MEFTAKQVARLLIDNAKGKVVLPANFSEQGMVTPEEAISNAFFSIMGLEKGKATVQDIQLAFRREEVRLGVFAVVEEVIREGILSESWRNPFLDQFVESRSQTRGDQTVFFLEAKNELHVSRISKDGKVSLDRQRFDEGQEITVDVKTYGIKVYEHLARIMLGRADWGSLVAHLNAAVEKFIQMEVYKAFAGVIALAPAQCKISGNKPTKTQILEVVREVKMLSGAQQVMLVGTGLALSGLEGVETLSEERNHRVQEEGALRVFHGIPLVELPQAVADANLAHGAEGRLVQPDNVIYVIPNNIGKPIKMIVEPELIDINESGVRVDDTIEFAVRFSFGLKVITGRAMGTITFTA